MEKQNKVSDTQKVAQKKYDQKTKMISVKYVLSDMNDYDRLSNYLEKTGKSANGFIKELINDFFEHKKFVMNDERVADYLKDYNVEGKLLDKLKTTVGEDRFNMIMNYCQSCIETELYKVYGDKGDAFDEWIEQFLEDIECGDIDINVPDKEFNKMIDRNISGSMGEVLYSG